MCDVTFSSNHRAPTAVSSGKAPLHGIGSFSGDFLVRGILPESIPANAGLATVPRPHAHLLTDVGMSAGCHLLSATQPGRVLGVLSSCSSAGRWRAPDGRQHGPPPLPSPHTHTHLSILIFFICMLQWSAKITGASIGAEGLGSGLAHGQGL